LSACGLSWAWLSWIQHPYILLPGSCHAGASWPFSLLAAFLFVLAWFSWQAGSGLEAARLPLNFVGAEDKIEVILKGGEFFLGEQGFIYVKEHFCFALW